MNEAILPLPPTT